MRHRIIRAACAGLLAAACAGAMAGGAGAAGAPKICKQTGVTAIKHALKPLFGTPSFSPGSHGNDCDLQGKNHFAEVYISPASQVASLESQEVTYNFNGHTPKMKPLPQIGAGAVLYYTGTTGGIVNFTAGGHFFQIFGPLTSNTVLIKLASALRTHFGH